MRVIFLPDFWTLILNIFAWAIIQPGTAALAACIPMKKLDPENFIFRTARWESGGEIYQRLFNIRSWKRKLPSGGAWFRKNGFSLYKLNSMDLDYLDHWIRETCRAEICHWAAIFPALLFFLWNQPFVGWIMVVYAGAFNLPLIIAQRYNRPKMKRMLKRICALHSRKTESLSQ